MTAQTLCGKCSHPMHWHECGAGADLTAGPCKCRNDIAMTTDDTRPLSAEEEAELRRGIASSLRDDYRYHPLTVAMCLATINAERARRAALVAAARELLQDQQDDGCPSCGGTGVAWDYPSHAALRAALEGEPS